MRQLLNSFRQRKILVNIGALFSGTAIARILSAISLLLIARQLGPDAYGQFISCLTLAKLSSVLLSWGLDTWLLRNGRSHKEYSLAQLSSTCLELKLKLGLIWIIGILMLSFFLNHDTFPQRLLIISALSIWFDEFSNTAWSTFKAALKNNITIWLMIGSQILFLLPTLWFLVGQVQNPYPYMFGRLVASGISSLIALFLVARVIGFKFQHSPSLLILRDTIPFGVSEGLAIIYERADVIIVGYLLGKTAVGFYGPALTLMTTLFIIPRSIYEVMLPVTSETFSRTPHQIIKQAYNIVLASTALGIVMSIGMAIIAKPLVWVLYGFEYTLSGDILTLLSPILILKSVSFSAATILTAVGWHNKRVIVQVVAASLNIILNLTLIQIYGLMGVAYVYILTETVLMGGYVLYLLIWQHTHRVELASS